MSSRTNVETKISRACATFEVNMFESNIGEHQLGGLPLWAVSIEIQFLCGQEALKRVLEQALRPYEMKDEG